MPVMFILINFPHKAVFVSLFISKNTIIMQISGIDWPTSFTITTHDHHSFAFQSQSIDLGGVHYEFSMSWKKARTIQGNSKKKSLFKLHTF